MKKRTAFVYFLIGCVSLISLEAIKSETWICRYEHQGKKKTFVRYRRGFEFVSDYDATSEILNENENNIHLYSFYSGLENYYATFLDKKKKYWLPYFMLSITIMIILFVFSSSDDTGIFIYGDQ